MAYNNHSLSLMITAKPRATIEVWTMQPVIKPLAIAIPYLEPRATDCVRTKILSGPGEIARSKVANAKETSDSIIILEL
jgi:hypothetical protein